MSKKIIIGIDLGGTKIMTGAINLRGEVLGEPVKVMTGGTDPSALIVKRITDSVEQVMSDLHIDRDMVLGIGIGATGPLDIEKGIILDCPQLPTMHYFRLREVIQAHFGIPVFMNNDANCLIYGETVFGVAAGKKNIIGLTLGTGIGCAVIMNGKIINGATGTAGEIWTSPYLSGTIEDYTCGQAVTDIYKALTGNEKSALEIHHLANDNDPQALDTWRQYGEHLSVALAWSINLLDPELVVLGGSVTHAHAYFMPAVKEKMAKYICEAPYQKTAIKIAELGDYAGFIGAACLVLEGK